MNRLTVIAIPILALALGACAGTPATAAPPTANAIAAVPTGPAASSATVTAPASAEPSEAIVPSTCIFDRDQGSGAHTAGKLVGHITSGRILFGIEGAGGTQGGTFAYAVIDKAGLHVYPTDDWTMGGAIWAPDGSIVFDSSRNDDRHLFRSALDGTHLVQLTSAFRSGEFAARFIGSDRLVFSSWSCKDERDLGLHIANADGSGITDLTPGHEVGSPISDDKATVSPNGKTIAFVRFSFNDDSIGAIWSIPATGGTPTRLTNDATGTTDPRFSPDGKTIMFTKQDAAGDFVLWTVPASGGTAVKLTKAPSGTSNIEADWSPDGSQIVVKMFMPGFDHNELHVIDADGTHDTTLWIGDHSTAESPDWGK